MKYSRSVVERRIQYAKQRFKENGIEYVLKNEKYGTFELFVAGKKFLFQADKGVIYPFSRKDIRGIDYIIQYLLWEGVLNG